ncbi:MAG: hypothetical protein P4L45_00745, partial [Ignavibacteriaceae bacterium]|nr:hypothetical protein [Ignavibacteriaceae bacterium]
MKIHIQKDDKYTKCGKPIISRWQASFLNITEDPAEANCKRCLGQCAPPSNRISNHALCAKTIKAELKQCFPEIKFHIKSESFSGGNSVNISWAFGATQAQIENITKKYEYGYFDGSDDSYHFTGSSNIVTPAGKIEELPSVKFVHTNRFIPVDIFTNMCNDFCSLVKIQYINFNTIYCGEYIGTIIHRLIYNNSLPTGYH